MAQPPDQPPYSASPFNPTPGGRPPGRSGCSKPLLIGCGAVLLLLGIGLIAMIYNAPKIVQWSFKAMEQDILGRLGPDVAPEDRARLVAAFEDARGAVAGNKVDVTKLQPFQNKVMEVAPANKKLTREEVLELTRALEELAGKKPPSP
ncbi:MAG TPA: hypothetical protein VJ885_13590 [Thermoanaerobaculia bacterium]|nr:hypothetical protein [Thermoanaerobaculia bacterium]